MKTLSVFLITFLIFGASELTQAQSGNTTFLEYSMSRTTTLPPYYTGQPLNAALSYYWFDHAMRVNSTHEVDSFFSVMHYNDTAKYIAAAIYTLTDDNPLSFYLWLSGRGVTPDPYSPRSNPSHVRLFFQNKFSEIRNDTGRSMYLLASDIIAQVHVVDTVSAFYPTRYLAKHMVLANTMVKDIIKGNYIPICTNDTLYSIKGKGGVKPQTIEPYATYPQHADSGDCLQFEYSLEWDRMPNNDYGTAWPMVDSTGTWLRPNTDYIVFLGIQSMRAEGSRIVFTIKPLWGMFGSAGGMYPVHSGIVFDPSDDFGIGANSGLTVSEWKNRLRARINLLKNP